MLTLLITPIEIQFSGILFKILDFSLKKINFKMSSVECEPFYSVLIVLDQPCQYGDYWWPGDGSGWNIKMLTKSFRNILSTACKGLRYVILFGLADVWIKKCWMIVYSIRGWIVHVSMIPQNHGETPIKVWIVTFSVWFLVTLGFV